MVELVDRATWDARDEPELPARSNVAPATTSPVATVPDVSGGALDRPLAGGAIGGDVASLQGAVIAIGFDPAPTTSP